MPGMRCCLLLAGLGVGCAEEQPPACTTLDLDCGAGYLPTFHNVYTNTLAKSCGADDNNCHSAAGHQANLSFAGDEDSTYAAVMAQSSLDPSRPRVEAGNAACSDLVVRIYGVGKDYQMPQGAALDAPAQCAIAQWVQNGATR
ncbi:MAG TPA: hypothetical protein VGC41_01985 [Kofleriaceae bacterium]